MDYFVGHLIEGEAAHYYEKLAGEIAGRFGAGDLSRSTPPHITLKPPFGAADIRPLRKKLLHMALDEKSLPFTLHGFGRFKEKGVIFLYVEGSDELWRRLREIVKAIAGFGESKTPPLDADNLKTHVSVARHLPEKAQETIWKYLKDFPAPRFERRFDNFALFRHEGDIWKVDDIFRFNQ